MGGRRRLPRAFRLPGNVKARSALHDNERQTTDLTSVPKPSSPTLAQKAVLTGIKTDVGVMPMTKRELRYRTALETALAEILAAKNSRTMVYWFIMLDNAIMAIEGALEENGRRRNKRGGQDRVEA
jgi:hypothetical protein